MAVYPLLALLWALVLVPPLVRRRAQTRAEFPEFDRVRLSSVGAAATASKVRDETAAPPIRRSATQRRRRVLALIGAGIVGTLVVALVMQTKLAWGMHLLVYDVLIAYVALLARASDKQTGRRSVVAPPVRRSVRAVPTHRAPRTIPRSASTPTALPALLQVSSR